jgi:hypothetical protein
MGHPKQDEKTGQAEQHVKNRKAEQTRTGRTGQAELSSRTR